MKHGTKVRLKESYARWHLDHPDVYWNGVTHTDDCYENETIIHLACCLGEPVHGEVQAIMTHFPFMETTYMVKFKVGRYTMTYWVEKKHVELL